jgi:hypothetical protein
MNVKLKSNQDEKGAGGIRTSLMGQRAGLHGQKLVPPGTTQEAKRGKGASWTL